MDISQEIKDGLNIALNEAQILGVKFDEEQGTVDITLAPIAVDENGNFFPDSRVKISIQPVGRFVASYRMGRWDDKNAEVLHFNPREIFSKVQEFVGSPIYGWEFIDCGDKGFDTWKNRLSFDYRSSKQHNIQHTLDIFQDNGQKHLSIRIWFDEFTLCDARHNPISVHKFIEDGKRGWDAVYARKDIAEKFGIYPIDSINEGASVEQRMNLWKKLQSFCVKFLKK